MPCHSYNHCKKQERKERYVEKLQDRKDMWELGGRVSDIISIQAKDIDFSKKEIVLTVKKRHGYIRPVFAHCVEEESRPFNISTVH